MVIFMYYLLTHYHKEKYTGFVKQSYQFSS